MKNIYIYGAGRSGTSMLAGIFSKAGYHMGDNLYPGRSSNPKGFFESSEINSLNENLLMFNNKLTNLKGVKRYCYNKKLKKGQLWLANMRPGEKLNISDILREKIITETNKKPFCYKDPRFSYTYPVWKPYSGEHVCLIIYRHPAKTIGSMIKEINSQAYLKSYKIAVKRLNEIWCNQYLSCIINSQSNHLFLHFDAIFKDETKEKLIEFTKCYNILNFEDNKLSRSTIDLSLVTNRSMKIYEKLNKLANACDN